MEEKVKVENRIKENNINYAFLGFLAVIFVVFIFLASNTPMLGEDETIYYNTGKEISKGQLPLLNYMDRPLVIPFLIPLVYSVFFILFGVSLGVAKVVIALFALLTLLLLYTIGKKISVWYGLSSSMLLLSLPYFSHFSLISYVEVPIAFFSILVIYTFLKINNYKKSILSGVIISLAFFTKHSALFLIASLLVFTAVSYFYNRNKKRLKFYLVSIFIALILSSTFIVRNIVAYGYPSIVGLNLLFDIPDQFKSTGWMVEISREISQEINFNSFISSFGFMSLFFLFLSCSYIFLSYKNLKSFDKNLLLLSLLTLILFLFAFNFASSTIVTDPRYLSIIFPQVALMGGYFLYKFKQKIKYSTIIVLLVIIFSAYSGITVAVNTFNSSRYTQGYIDSLKWIERNTPGNALIFSTYGGSVKYFADRNIVWGTMEEFPEIMRGSNSTYSHEVLKDYNVSYILVWQGIIAEDIVVPESNILGVFTYNFLNQVTNDTEHFKIVYQNSESVIFELL